MKRLKRFTIAEIDALDLSAERWSGSQFEYHTTFKFLLCCRWGYLFLATDGSFVERSGIDWIAERKEALTKGKP